MTRKPNPRRRVTHGAAEPAEEPSVIMHGERGERGEPGVPGISLVTCGTDRCFFAKQAMEIHDRLIETASRLKAFLVAGGIALPSLIALNVWLVKSTWETQISIQKLNTELGGWINVGPRYTPSDAEADKAKLLNDIKTWVNEALPPVWTRKSIENLEIRMQRLESVNERSYPVTKSGSVSPGVKDLDDFSPARK